MSESSVMPEALSRKLSCNVDAKEWAEEFVKAVRENPSIATDENTMNTWFANAIMAGYDRRDAEVRAALV